MDPSQREEIQTRKRIFEEFLGGKPSTQIEGVKREAVEKVFFFSDQQFNEVCEDLLEEIDRRARKDANPLKFNPQYSLKRNTIREQMSLLECEDMKSLVEDAFLVLNHKHPETPEDRLQCLNQLVEGLQEIVASNTPQDCASSLVMAAERVKKDVLAQTNPIVKLELLLNLLAESTYDTSANTQEILSLMRNALEEENTRMQQTVELSPALYDSLEKACLSKSRPEYLAAMAAHSQIPDPNAMAHQKTLCTIAEFMQLVNENQFVQQKPPQPTPSALPIAQAKDTLEIVIRRVIDSFEDLEQCIVSSKPLPEYQKCIKALSQEKPNLLIAYTELAMNTKLVEALPISDSIASDKEALSIAKHYYTALMETLP
ncbi:hypothetical protein NEOKW01_1753 [Nematocida sp. AWRm80]|nr:hypothetical protein NEOKW01_1753 [Nematocida sp. AWRm80]